MEKDDLGSEKEMNPELIGRRKLVKTMLGGVTLLAAYHVLPARWSVPTIDSIMLPAHAQTSGGPATFSITIASVNAASDTCGPDGETANITGTVAASDGRSMAGVEVNILYTKNPPGPGVTNRVVTVQAGNTYSLSEVLAADSGGPWDGPAYQAMATFVDVATYGTASATTTGSCGNLSGV